MRARCIPEVEGHFIRRGKDERNQLKRKTAISDGLSKCFCDLRRLLLYNFFFFLFFNNDLRFLEPAEDRASGEEDQEQWDADQDQRG